MSVNTDRGELRTDWLYVRGPTFVPGDGDFCDNGQEPGVRFWFAPRRAGDSTEYALRAEMRYPPRTDPGESERVGRDAFDVVTKILRTALAASPIRMGSVEGPHVTGQVATGTPGWHGCGRIGSSH